MSITVVRMINKPLFLATCICFILSGFGYNFPQVAFAQQPTPAIDPLSKAPPYPPDYCWRFATNENVSRNPQYPPTPFMYLPFSYSSNWEYEKWTSQMDHSSPNYEYQRKDDVGIVTSLGEKILLDDSLTSEPHKMGAMAWPTQGGPAKQYPYTTSPADRIRLDGYLAYYFSHATENWIGYDGHDGHDFAVGGDALAAADGTISFVGPRGRYGTVVEIYHPAGYLIRYAHLERAYVKEGDAVKAGDPIGQIGGSPKKADGSNTWGIHLHFMVFHWNSARNGGEWEVTDPFGWDPWLSPGQQTGDPLYACNGEISYNLWFGFWPQSVGGTKGSASRPGNDHYIGGWIGDSIPSTTPNLPNVPPTGGKPTDTALVIDISGSMGDAWQGGVKIESAKSAAANVVDMIEQESKIGAGTQQVSVISFSSSSKVESPSGADYQTARSAIAALGPQASTNIGAGIDSANQQLQNVQPGGSKVIVLMTDGLNNTGLSNAQVLEGPVKQAATAGTCIFTIGFGDKGDLDEPFLQQIASASSCGHYYYASSGVELQNVYIRSRHEALGKVEAEFKGKIQQGQTIALGQITVQPNQSALYATLNWPGSQLDLIVNDPAGQRVDQNYPGASISQSERLVYLIVNNPKPGTWNAMAFGRDVPEGTTDYNAIFSTRSAIGTTQASGASALWLFVLLAAVAVPVGAVLLQRRGQRLGYLKIGFRWNQRMLPAHLYLIVDGDKRQTFSLIDGFMIGRSRDSHLVLDDARVSRHHAVIRFANGRYFIQDTSRFGTLLNGRPIQASILHSGDRIAIGNQEFLFEENAK